MEILLKKEGYQVKGYPTGKAAMGLFKSQAFDLVIADIRLRKIDGLELIRQFKSVDEDIEIIVLTGSATIESVVKAMRAKGAFDLLTKPMENIDQFFDSIAQALKQTKLNREKKVFVQGLAQAKEKLEYHVEELTKELNKTREQSRSGAK